MDQVGEVAISPDGRWVAYVVTERNFEDDRNESAIWIVSSDGGEPYRLTSGQGSDNAPQWAPDGSWLAFSSDREERRQVYGIRPNGGEAWRITASATSVNEFEIAPDASRIAYLAAAERADADKELEELRGRPIVWDSAYADQWQRLWIAPLADRRASDAVRWSPDTLHVTTVVWRPDAGAVAYGARPSPVLRTFRRAAVYVQDESTGPARRVTGSPGPKTPVAWTSALGLIVSGPSSDDFTVNRLLWQVSLADGTVRPLTAELDENASYVTATDRTLLVEASHRTGRRLYRFSVRDGETAGAPVAVSDDGAFYTRFSATRDGTTIALLAERPTAAPNVHVTSTRRFAPRRLTDINPSLANLALGSHRVVQWSSRADGEQIEGVLTLPVGYREGERVPLLLVIHGGPAGVSSNRFSPTRGAYPIQVFAGLGYAVLQPNYRGSTGYGERFRGLNRGDISGRDWVDIDSGVDAMIRAGIADPRRLGIMGWSFGGHHTYWGITQTDRFAAASAGAGANDLISMYSQTDIPEFYHVYLGPKPWEDFELYEERSAFRGVAKVTTPLLIQVGEKDERVPAEQSIQFFEAMRAIGNAPTTLVLYPDQPHGVRAPRLVRDLLSRNVEWFSKWIPVEKDRAAGGT